MKKRFVFVISILMLIASFSFAGCEFPFGDKIPTLSAESLVLEYNLYENSENKKYKPQDSFELANGNYYYVYYLGMVDCVPIDLSNTENNSVFFDGTASITIELSLKEAVVDSSVKELKAIANSSVELKTSNYVKGSVSAGVAEMFTAQLEAGITSENSVSTTNTIEESVQMAVEQEKSFEKAVRYNLDVKESKRGYYLYTSVASMKLYEMVVYNPTLQKIEYMTSYCEIGKAVPGLIYSPTTFFDYGDYEITFEEEKIEDFERPDVKLDDEYEITLNADGGVIESGETTKNVKLSLAYGELPNPTRLGYNFAGWYLGNTKIEAGSIVSSNKELKARWDIKTSVVYTWNGTISLQDSFDLGLDIGNDKTNGINLSEVLDFATLKSQNYRMKITFNYKAQTMDFWLTKISKYKIGIKANGSEVYTFNCQINDDGNTYSKTEISPLLSIGNNPGTMQINFSTENIKTIYLSQMTMKIEFVK